MHSLDGRGHRRQFVGARYVSRLTLAWIAGALVAALSGWVPSDSRALFAQSADPASVNEPAEMRVREVYVPERDFEAFLAKKPEGVVVTLEEYRSWVARAAGATLDPTAELPPLAATVEAARYQGVVHRETMRFSAKVTVRLFDPERTPGWITCGLGTLPDTVAAARLDGQPAWIVRTDQGDQLLLEIEGEEPSNPRSRTRELEFDFVVPMIRDGDRDGIQGELVPAPDRTIELIIPGRVDVRTEGGVPTVNTEEVNGEDISTVGWQTAPGSQLKASWRRPTTGQQAPILIANHRVEAIVRPEFALIYSVAIIDIHRNPTGSVDFVLDPLAQVLKLAASSANGQPMAVEGTRTAEGLFRVDLATSVIDSLRIEFLVQIPVVNRVAALSIPTVSGAVANRGELQLLDPGYRLELTDLAGMNEEPNRNRVSSGESADVERLARGGVSAAFSFDVETPSIRVALVESTVDWDWSTSSRLRVGEREVLWESVWQLAVRGTRVHELTLPIPEGWEFDGLIERPTPAGPLGVNVESPEEDARELRLTFSRALEDARPFRVRAQFRWKGLTTAGRDDPRPISLTLTAPALADHVRHAVGVSRIDGWELTATELEGWTALSREESDRLGWTQIKGEGNESWIGGFWTEIPRPGMSLRFAPRRPRGEAQLVTSLLATEQRSSEDPAVRRARIRMELRLAVVDREIERLELQIPGVDASTEVEIRDSSRVNGIREIVRTETGRAVTFAAPWKGERSFVIEFERWYRPGESTVLPSLELPDRFGLESFWIVGSEGSVEVSVRPGDGLTAFDLDRVPSFAGGFVEGRPVSAYRRSSGGEPGSWSTTVYDRAPVLTRFAKELTLRSQVDADGVMRTEATTVLAYDRAQSLTVELPKGALLVGVSIDGVPVGKVQATTRSDAGGGSSFTVPLPARSFAHVLFTYDSSGAADAVEAWPEWGTWRAEGPRLVDVPVGQVTWEIYPPRGGTVAVSGGNMVATESSSSGFWNDIVVPISKGRAPRWSWSSRESAPRPDLPPLTDSERAGAKSSQSRGGLESTRKRSRPQPAAPSARLLAVGSPQAFTKFAGDPVLEVHVESDSMAVGLRRFGFILTLAFLWILFGGRLWLGFWIATLLGSGALLCASFPSQPALWPLVSVVEAAMVFIVLCPLVALVRVVIGWRRRRVLSGLSIGASLVLFAALFPGSVAFADGDGSQPRGFDEGHDGVIIGMPDSGWLSGPLGSFKVFIPQARFLDLWRRAFPDEPAPGDDAPSSPAPSSSQSGTSSFSYERTVRGPADYTLEFIDDRFLLKGSIDFLMLGNGPWEIELPTESGVVEARFDGESAAVTRDDRSAKLRVIEPGLHRLEIVLTGSVEQGGGRGATEVHLLPGTSTRIVATLPEGSELTLGEVAREQLAFHEGQRAEFRLGTDAQLAFGWRLPATEGVVDAREKSTSYSAFTLEPGLLRVSRWERLSFVGGERAEVRYRIDGDWRVTEVQGSNEEGVEDWQVVRVDDQPYLVVQFRTPSKDQSFWVRGVRPLTSETELQSPTLTLVDGRQESFFGTLPNEANGQRISAESLEGLRRVTASQLPFPITSQAGLRFYGTFGSGSASRLRLESDASRLELIQSGILWRGWERASASIRLSPTQASSNGLRHSFSIPDGWRVTTVYSSLLKEWFIEASEPNATLRLTLSDRWKESSWVAIELERSLPSPRSPVALPNLSWIEAPAGHGWVRTTWLVTADAELDFVPVKPQAGWTIGAKDSTLLERSVRPGSTRRFVWGWESRTPVAPAPEGAESLVLQVGERSAKVSATVVSAARLDPRELLVNAKVLLDIRFAPRERVELRLPAGADVLRVDGANLRRKAVTSTAESTQLVIDFESPLRGEIEFELSYRIGRSGEEANRSAVMTPLTMTTDGEDQAVDHYLVVWQPTDAELEVVSQVGLSRVEPGKMPNWPSAISEQRWFAALRSTRPDWRFEWLDRSIGIDTKVSAVVTLAELESVIGRDGTVRTRATYTLVNRSLQFLEIDLPAGGELWGVTVDGRSVPVGNLLAGGSSSLRIPVARPVEIGLPQEIRLTYQEPMWEDGVSSYGFVAPSIRAAGIAEEDSEVRILETVWDVLVPNDSVLRETGERMREVPSTLKPSQKLQALLDNREQLVRAAREGSSRKLRARARDELGRLEQALVDQLAELTEATRELPDSDDPEKAVMLARSRQLLSAGEEARDAVRTELGRSQAEDDSSGELFNDRVRFRQSDVWGKADGKKNSRASGPLPIRVPRWDAVILSPLSGAQAVQGTGSGSRTSGSPTSDLSPAEGSVTGVDYSFDPPGYDRITFHRADGDATLEVEIGRPWSLSAMAAAGALLLLLGLAVIFWRRQQRSD